MDKLIEDLLTIERSANDSMSELEDEQSAQALLISKEIARRNLDIKRKADQAIQALKQEAEAETQARLEEIENDYNEKTQQIKSYFEENTPKWREEWVRRILEISP